MDVSDEKRFAVRAEQVRGVGIDVVAVEGEVDVREGAELASVLTGRRGPVVVDLRGCSFMGSEGLRALLDGRRAASTREARFVLAVTPGSAVDRLLRTIAGEVIFNLQHTLYEAVTAACAPARRAPERRAAA